MNCCICNKPAYKNKHRCYEHYTEYRRTWYQNRLKQVRDKKYWIKSDKQPKRRFNKAKREASKRGLEWNIPYEDWLNLVIDKKCYYDNEKLPTNGSGLDRKDNNKGYTLDNVVPCCYDCNRTKLDRFSCEEFKIMMDALLEWKKKKN